MSKKQTKPLPVEEEICSICLDNLSSSEITVTKCQHKFHSNCLVSSISKCPVCRQTIREVLHQEAFDQSIAERRSGEIVNLTIYDIDRPEEMINSTRQIEANIAEFERLRQRQRQRIAERRPGQSFNQYIEEYAERRIEQSFSQSIEEYTERRIEESRRQVEEFRQRVEESRQRREETARRIGETRQRIEESTQQINEIHNEIQQPFLRIKNYLSRIFS